MINPKHPFSSTFVASIRLLNEKPSQSNWKEIAFAGRSNVGKSSLLNALCGNKHLAKISNTPGRTRTLNFFVVNSLRCYFVDLPGYGYARASKTEQADWRAAVDAYVTQSAELTGMLVLIDSMVGPTPLDVSLIQYLEQQTKRYALILTKSDRARQAELALTKKKIAELHVDVPTILVSSKTKMGVDKCRELIQEWSE